MAWPPRAPLESFRMDAGEQDSVVAGTGGSGATAPSTDWFHRESADTSQTGQQDQPARRVSRYRLAMTLAWAAGTAGVFVLFLRISLTMSIDSDAANNALQAWDLLHGHLLLHGWLIGDATYYTFDLPLIALVEAIFGLHTIAMHVALALIYLVVAICAVAIAVTGARGATARFSRAALVVAVLAAPMLIASDRWVPIGIPDHTGTTIFLLVSCLLVDRATTRRFTAPLICVILAAGQIGDVTVRYAIVPAICVVCLYQMVAARKIRTGDAAILVAAIVSLPLATVARAVMRHFGSYLMVSPKTKIAPVSQWGHNARVTWLTIRELFGSEAPPHAAPAGPWVFFGSACLLVAAAGFIAVLVRWPRATRAEQVLAAGIAANLGVYVISTLPGPNNPHDIVAVLPASAALAARLLVPARLPSRLPGLAVTGAVSVMAAVAALLPLSLLATHPLVGGGSQQQLVAWLESNRLTYGLGGYWNASAVALLTSNRVQIRTVEFYQGRQADPYPWETSAFWFDPALHYANFVVDQDSNPAQVSVIERVFGKPALTHNIGSMQILVYHKNLLTQVVQLSQLKPPIMPPVS